MVVSGFFSSIGIWPHQTVTAAMREKAEEALERMEVAHLEDRGMDELSSGEARRVLIARALVHDPKALLLDEPTASLDLRALRDLRDAMRRLANSGIAILLVTHHLADIIPEISRVVLLKEGRVFRDGAKREMLTVECLNELYGLEVDLIERDGFYYSW
jgi:iron complex transport system ATP-binding protein